MLYILWTILNTAAIFLCHLLIVFGWKLIRERYGLFAALFFVFVFFSFHNRKPTNNNNNQQTNTNEVEKWKFTERDSLQKNSTAWNWFNIDNTPISSYNLFYTHGRDKITGKHVPIDASSGVEGWSIGTQWKPYMIDVEQTENNEQFRYTVMALLNGRCWALLFICRKNIYGYCAGNKPFELGALLMNKKLTRCSKSERLGTVLLPKLFISNVERNLIRTD